jgi:flagellar basal-body rod modification protein FlgD
MIGSVTSSGTSTVAQPGGPTLGKQDFLKLLITQLRNQDPLNPLDQNEFLSQTAQFTSLENLQNISAELAEMKELSRGNSLAQGASLLGKSAIAVGRDVSLGLSPVELPFLMETTGSVRIDIMDANNTVMRQLTSDTLPTGAQSLTWDGRDSAGQQVTPGVYHYRVVPQGGAIAVAAAGTLTGMTPSGNTVVYHLGDAVVRAEDLITVG